jgi:hypothetical protein
MTVNVPDEIVDKFNERRCRHGGGNVQAGCQGKPPILKLETMVKVPFVNQTKNAIAPVKSSNVFGNREPLLFDWCFIGALLQFYEGACQWSVDMSVEGESDRPNSVRDRIRNRPASGNIMHS